MNDMLEVKMAFLESLAEMYCDILEGRWPSQYMTDSVVGYAAVLGLSAFEVDRLHSALIS